MKQGTKDIAPYFGGVLSKRQQHLRVNGRRVYFAPGAKLPEMVKEIFNFNLCSL